MALVGEKVSCAICGKEILVDRPNRKYCSAKCASNAHRNRYKRVMGYVKICEFCGEEYTARRCDSKYCSQKCNRKVDVIRRREKIKSSGVKKMKPKEPETKINKDIDRIEVLAEKEGLSYGQYVAKYGL